MTPGEEFLCDNDLADQLIEQGRATLVDDNGRSSDAETETVATPVTPDTKSEDVPVNKAAVTGKRTKAIIEAEVAADEAALATAEAELASPGPLPESV